MKKIIVPQGCRSDKGLSDPVIKRLKEYFEVKVLELVPQDFGKSYYRMDGAIYAYHPDLVLITGDRVEMCAAAAAAFHNKVKIAHFYAGIINDPVTTYDDVDRHCITLWSDIQFCEDHCSGIRTNMLKQACELPSNVHIVGISHLDDLEVDESKVPTGIYNQNKGVTCNFIRGKRERIPYDLVLINAEPLTENIPNFCKEKYTIWIGGNPDGHVHQNGSVSYDNLPRPQFMGLLKNCQRFITNSSCAIYEAPHFLKPEQIIMVGDRNKNRPKGPFKTGASDRIVEILKEYLK